MPFDSKTLTAACHCRGVQFTITLPSECLPLQVHLCHCSICRYTHGAPCTFHAPLPDGIKPEFKSRSGFENLTAYNFPSNGTKYFCSTCGCHIGDRAHDDHRWVISTAIFDTNKKETGIWEFETHLCPQSAADGGISTFLLSINGREMKMLDPPSSLPTAAKAPRIEEANKDEKLQAKCHCGGVSFEISRPTTEFTTDPSSKNWVSPLDSRKWLALIDLCKDCRLVNGTHVIGWMFVPKTHISPTLPSTLAIGTSKKYSSSEGVVRTFCGTCGATVFYSCVQRPEIVDIATGILRAPEGVMAENWALWRAGRPAWSEDGLAYDTGFSRALIEGMKQWGIERGHTEDFTIP